jgi:hypothetical protein
VRIETHESADQRNVRELTDLEEAPMSKLPAFLAFRTGLTNDPSYAELGKHAD